MKLKSKIDFPHKYEGLILECAKESFWARLIDLTDYGQPDMEAEFLLKHIKEKDHIKVTQGAIFDFILTLSEVEGKLVGSSQIIFHPVRYWTKEEIEEAKMAAQELFDSIQWDD